jgi:hypothetical protein
VGDPLEVGRLVGYFPVDYGGFTGADVYRYSYDSELSTFELNYWLRPRGRPDRLVLYPNGRWCRERQTGPVLSYMGGLRFLSLSEDFEFRAASLTESGDGTFAGLGRYTAIRSSPRLTMPGPPPTARSLSWAKSASWAATGSGRTWPPWPPTISPG